MWSGDSDEPIDVIGEFECKNPRDKATKVVADDCHGLDAQRVEKVFQLSANLTRSVVVTQHGLIGVTKSFEVQCNHPMIACKHRNLVAPPEKAVGKSMQQQHDMIALGAALDIMKLRRLRTIQLRICQ